MRTPDRVVVPPDSRFDKNEYVYHARVYGDESKETWIWVYGPVPAGVPICHQSVEPARTWVTPMSASVKTEPVYERPRDLTMRSADNRSSE